MSKSPGLPRLGAFFSMLTEVETRKLLEGAVTRKFGKGQVIFRKGDAGSGMFVVLSGYVAVSIDSASGNDRPLRAYGPGDVIGDISMFDGKGRISGAMALEDVPPEVRSPQRFRADAFRPARACSQCDRLPVRADETPT